MRIRARDIRERGREIRGGADRSEISQIGRPDWRGHDERDARILERDKELGCFVCWSFSVLMVCVRVGVDWDILGDGRKFGDGGMGKTPKNPHRHELEHIGMIIAVEK